jgi:hypothetical protein
VWRRRDQARLDDVIEYLRGIATILMKIDAKIAELIEILDGETDEEAEP